MRRYCEISCHLLVGTAFFALAMTGRLDMASIAVFVPAFTVCFYRVIRKLPPLLSARSAFYLCCAYVGVFLFDFTTYSRSLVGSAVHMVLFLQLIKLHQRKSDRDYFYVIVLAFLKILAASSLTVDMSFAATLVLFLIALVSMLISFEMYRCERDTKMTTRETVVALGGTSVWTTLCIIAIGSALFFIIPRGGTAYFSNAAVPPLLVSGFSDSVGLGQIGQLKLSSAVVMHAKRITGTPFAVLKWRGVALDTFDGFNWSKIDRTRTNVRIENSAYKLPGGTAPGERVAYDILLEPLATTALFGPHSIRQISGRGVPAIEVDKDNAVFTRFQQPQRLHYQVQSEIVRITPAKDRPVAVQAATEHVGDNYLQLPPDLDPRIRALAATITRDAQTPFDKAVRVEAHLRKNYKYSLTLDWEPGSQPLSTFLFQAKSGHCEYFASSMAILLRASGVPTRIVNGFLMGDYNPVGDAYIVRQSDAHSWVEVYLEGTDWTEFDPTPVGTNQTDPGLMDQLHHYADAMGLFWSTYILTYDTGNQIQLFQSAYESVDKLQRDLHTRKDRWALGLQQFAAQVSASIRQTIASGAIWGYSALLIAGILVYGMRQEIARRWWLLRIRKTGRVDDRVIDALFYRAVALVGKHGPRRRDSETWREWIGIVPHDQCRSILQRALEVYEKAKYGPEASSPADVAVLQEALRDLQALLQYRA